MRRVSKRDITIVVLRDLTPLEQFVLSIAPDSDVTIMYLLDISNSISNCYKIAFRGALRPWSNHEASNKITEYSYKFANIVIICKPSGV